jgi:hypothetical protein
MTSPFAAIVPEEARHDFADLSGNTAPIRRGERCTSTSELFAARGHPQAFTKKITIATAITIAMPTV